MGPVEMDVGTAFQILEIDDRTVDDELIINVYVARLEDNPARSDEFRNALRAIAKANNSKKLEDFLQHGIVMNTEAPASLEWPVGLENIGNTCYLNSLLQFYFTIKPLRHIVLDFDDFKMEITDENMKQKRVGSRQVKKNEVIRSQRCKPT